ncbi:uncharacterized protein LOC101846614 [Aplysia californica]|uniref:Scavenger receptor class B member 1 n=1 Tax=Aplysia californica TaxID=6500 RepID=A0ABM0JA71_APLCA|nr:uncharacterized protein LOC101846614 [Aplysia californica]
MADSNPSHNDPGNKEDSPQGSGSPDKLPDPSSASQGSPTNPQNAPNSENASPNSQAAANSQRAPVKEKQSSPKGQGSPKDEVKTKGDGGSPEDGNEAKRSQGSSKGSSPESRNEASKTHKSSKGNSPESQNETKKSPGSTKGSSPQSQNEAKKSPGSSKGSSPQSQNEAKKSSGSSKGSSPERRQGSPRNQSVSTTGGQRSSARDNKGTVGGEKASPSSENGSGNGSRGESRTSHRSAAQQLRRKSPDYGATADRSDYVAHPPSDDIEPLLQAEVVRVDSPRDSPPYQAWGMRSSSAPLDKASSSKGSLDTIEAGSRRHRKKECRYANLPCMCVKSTFCSVGVTIIMVLSVALLLCIQFLILPTLKSRIIQSLTLRNTTSEAWANPKAETWVSCYFFNVTNAAHISGRDRSVRLNEMGPYVYRVKVEKTDITWNDDNGTVSFRETFTFHFDPEKSAGSEDDVITTVDVPTAMVHTLAGVGSDAVDALFSLDGQTFLTRTVRELLWGYESEVLHTIERKLKKVDVFHLLTDVISNIPTTFGYFSGQNNTAGPMLNVYTGAKDFRKFNQVHSWNNYRKLPYWSSKQANKIRGTDGSMFSPFPNKNSKLTLFSSQLYRAFDLKFKKSLSEKGIGCLRYVVPNSQFSNTTMAGNITASFLSDAADAADDGFSHLIDGSKELGKQNNFIPSKAHGTRTEEDGLWSDKVTKINKNDKDDNEENDDEDDEDDEEKEEEDEDEDEDEDDDEDDDDDDDDDESEGKRGGFCVPKCLPNGVYSLESVSDGAPLYVSLPHFLGADPVYSHSIEGLSPSEAAHRPFFDVDDVTGVPLSQQRRHQLNARLPGYSGDELGTFVPLFWVDSGNKLDDESVSKIKTAHMTYRALQTLLLFALGLAVVSWVFIIAIIVSRNCSKKEC